jgi:hypothetical protein
MLEPRTEAGHLNIPWLVSRGVPFRDAVEYFKKRTYREAINNIHSTRSARLEEA